MKNFINEIIFLDSVFKILGDPPRFEESLKKILRMSQESMGAETSAFYILDEVLGFTEITLTDRSEETSTMISKEDVRRLMKYDRPTRIVAREAQGEDSRMLNALNAEVCVILPLIYTEQEKVGCWVLFSSDPGFADDEQRLVLMMMISRNVAQTRMLEKLRKKNEEREKTLQTILDNVVDGIVAVDQRGVFKTWNKAAELIMKAGPTTAPREAWSETYGLYLPDGETLCPAHQLPLNQALQGHYVEDMLLVLKPPKERGTKWIKVDARPIINQSHEQEGAVAIFRDITDKHLALEKVRDSRAQWKALVENTPVWVLGIDPGGKITFSNQGLFGLDKSEMIGMPWIDFVKSDFRERMNEVVTSAIQVGKKTEAVEVALSYRNKEPKWYSMSVGIIEKNGITAGLVLMGTDITDKKQIEAQHAVTERMASMGIIVAGVAHEINNPLSAIITNLELAMQDVKEAVSGENKQELLQELQDAREASERVKNIVQDLKLFSRGQDNALCAVDVESVLNSCVKLTWNEIRHRAKLIKQFSKVPKVRGNESRLAQVFVNLIMNAAQGIPEGRIDEHRITLSTFMIGHDQVVVEITDTGCGMDEDVLSKIFTPFFTTKPIGVGTGLGLSIAHKIIQSVGGKILVESHPGQGSTFKVVLMVQEEESRALLTKHENRQKIQVKRGKILVIDDEPLVMESIRRVLAPTHDVTTAQSAAEALDIIQQNKQSAWDLILCDVMMPEMTGVDFFEEVQINYPALTHKIIFMTGGTFSNVTSEFLKKSLNQKLEKPLDPDILNRIVQEHIQKHKPHAAS